MQGLILAAGMGKRLGPYTKEATKCMVPVNGKTLIEYSIEALLYAGIKKLILVIGYKGQKLKDFLAGKYPEMEIQYIENPIYDKTNNIYSLSLAENEMIKDDTLLLESDLIYDKEILKELVENKEKNLAVVSPFENWMDGTCALLDENNNITGLLDKNAFNWNEINKYYKTVNIYKFSKEFSEKYYLPFLKAYRIAYGENEYYEQALKVIAFLDSTNLKGFPVQGDRWYEIDDMADLAVAENRFATGAVKVQKTQNRYGGYWRFPNLIDFCYLVNPYFPPSKLVDELKANFETLLTQYPSGANEQSLLASKIFGVSKENIIVGNGAAELISAVSTRIDGKVLVPTPTFNEYPERFEKYISKDSVIYMDTSNSDFYYNSKTILESVSKNPEIKTVLLINPDNPSGNFLSEQDVILLLDELKKKNITLIFDESFIDFANSKERYTLISQEIIEKYNNLIIIKSISKSFGVPGLRLGILVNGDKNLINKLKKDISIWNINSFAENYLQIYEKYKKTYFSSCDLIAKERERFITELRKIPNLKVWDSRANFVLCLISEDSKINATELTEKLLTEHNIFIKDLSTKKGFAGKSYIRLAVRNTEDNNKLLKVLNELM